jgi:large conductance mechanosensitive channel
MGFISEFKAFAMRGNVMDMAIGIVIGAAFGKIVSSFVKDVVMPPIGMITGGVDFSDMKMTLKEAVVDGAGAETAAAVTLNYGMFVNTVIDFLIIALAIFVVVKIMNKAKKKEEEAPAAPPKPTKDQELLAEIRDSLKARG